MCVMEIGNIDGTANTQNGVRRQRKKGRSSLTRSGIEPGTSEIIHRGCHNSLYYKYYSNHNFGYTTSNIQTTTNQEKLVSEYRESRQGPRY